MAAIESAILRMASTIGSVWSGGSKPGKVE
jgi:hypothetical protein